MWTFAQLTGKIYQNGVYVATGYSGAPGYVDNPADQQLKAEGPLPVGFYTITAPYQNPKTGPYTMNLEPDSANQMYGRGDFRIHGDSITAPGTASEGCIVLARAIRERIWNSGDHRLQVVSNVVVGTVQ
jgi:hypothetical protein